MCKNSKISHLNEYFSLYGYYSSKHISSFIGNKHVFEIVSMALDLLRASIVFKITHRPTYRIQLRMGIHSGPVVGIVSGSKTPKYWYI